MAEGGIDADERPGRRGWVFSIGVGVLYGAVPLVTLGMCAPLPFIYAAVRRNSFPLGIFTSLYIAWVMVVFKMASGGGSHSMFENMMLGGLWLGSTVHAFAVGVIGCRGPRRRKRDIIVTPLAVERDRIAQAAASRRRRLRAKARALAERDPDAARELRIGRPDLPRTHDDGGLIDVNHVPARVLATLPGLDSAAIVRLIERRVARGGFRSVEDMARDLALPTDLLHDLAEVAIFLG
ncbi:ComEA family DNA-binding protein [Actinomadura atramentaria]|uniref:ComEA family DNA-binding protein n=1 Tax=Actinomadura atramentaria TaxID=1990 RepID=UPI0003A3F4B1|nr:type II secretion system protein GspK [Actinomadura atramentaria]